MPIEMIDEPSKKQNVEKVKEEVKAVLSLEVNLGAIIVTKNISAWRTHFYSALKDKKKEKGCELMKFTFEKQKEKDNYKVWRIS